MIRWAEMKWCLHEKWCVAGKEEVEEEYVYDGMNAASWVFLRELELELVLRWTTWT